MVKKEKKTFLITVVNRIKGNSFSLKEGKFVSDVKKKIIYSVGGDALVYGGPEKQLVNNWAGWGPARGRRL